MKKIAIVVHGGAGPDSDFIKKNLKEYKKGLEAAVNAGYKILENGGASLDAVETAIKLLEDNPLFNAGKGSALNEKAEVEMDASIMSGYDLSSGAVANVRNVRNPITLARAVMERTKHIFLGGMGAMEFAKSINVPMEPESYFITEYQYGEYEKARQEENDNSQQLAIEQMNKQHGTVGVVALDSKGNLVAGTSTGGLQFCKPGRIADTAMIGIATYANNETCAVSTTGEGEFHIKHVTAFHIAALMEYNGMSLKDACHYLIHEKCKHVTADMGLIAIDKQGNMVTAFNTQRMHRASRSSDQELTIAIYPE